MSSSLIGLPRRNAWRGRTSLVTYYRSPWVLITDEVFEVRGPYPYRFHIAYLRDTGWRMDRYGYELWASYRGMAVRLLVCPDRRVFGQIRRALLRALEYALERREEALAQTEQM